MNSNGNRLKLAIKGLGLTQEDAAKKLGITRQTLNNYFNRAELDDEFIQNVKEKLGVSINEGGFVEFDLGSSVKRTEAISEVILSAIAELLAKANNQSSTVVREQLESLVNSRLK